MREDGQVVGGRVGTFASTRPDLDSVRPAIPTTPAALPAIHNELKT